MKRTDERGDTLVEVLVAISVLAIVIVGAFSLMNKGVAQVYDNMERAEVRLLINRQTESLTYARDQHLRSLNGEVLDAYDAAAAIAWNNIIAQPALSTPPDLNNCVSSDAFSLKRNTTDELEFSGSVSNDVAGGFPTPGDGLWIQKMQSSAGVPYKDFYIRACWNQNTSIQTQVISTIVRLYDR
jgi:prepilin-type N-terminal cleavage/methylation domain-containing protein